MSRNSVAAAPPAGTGTRAVECGGGGGGGGGGSELWYGVAEAAGVSAVSGLTPIRGSVGSTERGVEPGSTGGRGQLGGVGDAAPHCPGGGTGGGIGGGRVGEPSDDDTTPAVGSVVASGCVVSPASGAGTPSVGAVSSVMCILLRTDMVRRASLPGGNQRCAYWTKSHVKGRYAPLVLA